MKEFAKKIVSKIEQKTVANFQIVILDEADLLTNDAQCALRRTIEDYSGQTRFCIICNYVTKIIDPIVSRCAKFRFNCLDKETQIRHLRRIATAEKLAVKDNIINKIQEVSKGDLRKSINLLQTISSINPSLIDEDLILEICGIIPEDEIISFISSCKATSKKELYSNMFEFSTKGYNTKILLNELAHYFIEKERDLGEKTKIRLLKILIRKESEIISKADNQSLLQDLGNELNEVFLDV